MLPGQLGLFTPDEAPPPPPLGPVEIRREAEISPCGMFRWTLKRFWHAGPYVCWVMLNPSTADAERDDPTIREVIRFTRLWGYQGLVVVNLYPFRSSSPAVCRRWSEQNEYANDVNDALDHNRKVILDVTNDADLIMAAWGAPPWAHGWSEVIADDIRGTFDHGGPVRQIHCLGTTQDGSPKHPLARGVHRIPRDQQPIFSNREKRTTTDGQEQ